MRRIGWLIAAWLVVLVPLRAALFHPSRTKKEEPKIRPLEIAPVAVSKKEKSNKLEVEEKPMETMVTKLPNTMSETRKYFTVTLDGSADYLTMLITKSKQDEKLDIIQEAFLGKLKNVDRILTLTQEKLVKAFTLNEMKELEEINNHRLVKKFTDTLRDESSITQFEAYSDFDLEDVSQERKDLIANYLELSSHFDKSFRVTKAFMRSAGKVLDKPVMYSDETFASMEMAMNKSNDIKNVAFRTKGFSFDELKELLKQKCKKVALVEDEIRTQVLEEVFK